jgi:CRISPR-associated protein Cas1
MAVLYLTEQGSIVRKTSDRLIVEKNHETLLEVPCLKLDTLLIYGNVQVTTQALAELLDHGIELAFLSMSGKLRGQLTPPKAKNIPLRMRQYDLARSEAFCLRLARTLVAAKIGNSLAVVSRFRENHPEKVSREEVRELRESAAGVERAASLESLLGTEGSAAARYFSALGKMVPAEMGFDGRNRRPPRDPLNALLSFGYVLVGQELQSLLDAMGFDPYLGFYHQVDYGRPSLALDLLEEFRAPLVDRFSTTLLNTEVLRKDDFFTTAEGGVELHREAMKRYFTAYQKELTMPLSLGGEQLSFRHLFRRQAERLAHTLMDNAQYEPFKLPC